MKKHRKRKKRTKYTNLQQRLWFVLHFLVRFTLLAVPLYLVMWFGDMGFLQAAVTNNSVAVANALGLNVEDMGYAVRVAMPSGSGILNIDADCTGWKSMLAFFALVFAVPGIEVKKRLKAVAVGVPIIYATNIARVVFIFYIAIAQGMAQAEIFHIYLWRFGLTALILLLWFAWLKRINFRIK